MRRRSTPARKHAESDLIFETDPRFLVFDKCCLEALKVGGIGMACVRDRPSIPPQMCMTRRDVTRRLRERRKC